MCKNAKGTVLLNGVIVGWRTARVFGPRMKVRVFLRCSYAQPIHLPGCT
jgi:hypothetical protein